MVREKIRSKCVKMVSGYRHVRRIRMFPFFSVSKFYKFAHYVKKFTSSGWRRETCAEAAGQERDRKCVGRLAQLGGEGTEACSGVVGV